MNRLEPPLKRNCEEWRQKEKQYQLQIKRAQKHNREIQNKLDSIPPERKGTAGEIILTEDLRKAFPKRRFSKRKVGIEMPDTIKQSWKMERKSLPRFCGIGRLVT